MGCGYPVSLIFYKPDKLPSPVFEDPYCTSSGIIIRQKDLVGGEYSAAACCSPEESSYFAKVYRGKTSINSAASV